MGSPVLDGDTLIVHVRGHDEPWLPTFDSVLAGANRETLNIAAFSCTGSVFSPSRHASIIFTALSTNARTARARLAGSVFCFDSQAPRHHPHRCLRFWESIL